MESPIRPTRREKRLLLRRGKRGEEFTSYVDNKGNEFDYKIAAKLSSFLNIFFGCTKRGFPVVVKHLKYDAWAFYPFFFIRKNYKGDLPKLETTINHERIHIVQQYDIHITFSLPLLMLSGLSEIFGWFNPLFILLLIPFIPTIFYGVAMILSLRELILLKSEYEKTVISFEEIRRNTCFERESISRSTNSEYLRNRKLWSVLAYTKFRIFKNYGL